MGGPCKQQNGKKPDGQFGTGGDLDSSGDDSGHRLKS